MCMFTIQRSIQREKVSLSCCCLKMADEKSRQAKNCAIFGEFLSNLKVVNFYIRLNGDCEQHRISKLAFGRENVVVELKKEANEADIEAVEFRLPIKIQLIPRTISGIKAAVGGWIFRTSFEEVEDLKSPVKDQNRHPRCVKCDSQLLKREYADGGLVEVAELTGSSYFCHNHGHDDDHRPDQQQALSPSVIPVEAWNNGVNVVVHSTVFDENKIRISDGDDNIVCCGRCCKKLGSKQQHLLLLNDQAINKSYLKDVISRISNGKKILIKSKEEDGRVLLLWPMDIRLLSSDGAVAGRKVLYKMCSKDEAVKARNSEIAAVDSLVDVMAELVGSSCKLPLVWRFVGDFTVGFVTT